MKKINNKKKLFFKKWLKFFLKQFLNRIFINPEMALECVSSIFKQSISKKFSTTIYWQYWQ